jgi:hypothetical protein
VPARAGRRGAGGRVHGRGAGLPRRGVAGHRRHSGRGGDLLLRQPATATSGSCRSSREAARAWWSTPRKPKSPSAGKGAT